MVQVTPTSTPELERILAGAQLPALPQSAIRILELSQDPKNGPPEFAVPIESDPGLAGQVLRFVNSSYFGFSREISSIKLAITLVGIRTIKNFTLWSAIFSLMPNPKCGPFELKRLWQDSLRRGLFARAAGRLQGLKEADELFAAALLQDMSVPILAKEFPDEYNEMLGRRAAGQVRLSDLERERFGWTHADASAMMASRWDLPAELVEPIRLHAEGAESFESREPDIAQRCVNVSALLPACADEQWYERALFVDAYDRLRDGKGPVVTEMLANVDAEFVDFAPVLQMSVPAKSLVDSYEEMDADSA